ncbi:hypothetical protein WM25_14080 [Burkholderia ubonensis]|nr:hypothetical protein WM25_14080 [Burkholderia ubonensis]
MCESRTFDVLKQAQQDWLMLSRAIARSNQCRLKPVVCDQIGSMTQPATSVAAATSIVTSLRVLGDGIFLFLQIIFNSRDESERDLDARVDIRVQARKSVIGVINHITSM